MITKRVGWVFDVGGSVSFVLLGIISLSIALCSNSRNFAMFRYCTLSSIPSGADSLVNNYHFFMRSAVEFFPIVGEVDKC